MALLERLQRDQSLARYAGWFIPLKIETNGSEWGKWVSRYQHEGNSIPIVFVVRADGQRVQVPLDRLSAESQQAAKEEVRKLRAAGASK